MSKAEDVGKHQLTLEINKHHPPASRFCTVGRGYHEWWGAARFCPPVRSNFFIWFFGAIYSEGKDVCMYLIIADNVSD